MKFLIVFTILLSFFGSDVSRYLLIMTRMLQMILHLPMVQVPIPAIIIMWFKILIKVVMFDVLDEFESFDW